MNEAKLAKYVKDGVLTVPDGIAIREVLGQYNCRRTVEEVASWFGLGLNEADAILRARKSQKKAA